MTFDKTSFRLTDSGRVPAVLLGLGVGGLVLTGAGYFANPKQCLHSYLTAFVCWLTVGLGGLFFVLLHHLTHAKWSTVLRRLVESLMATLPWLLLLALPVLTVGLPQLYAWADPADTSHMLALKRPWLRPGFFQMRALIYFAIWGALAWVLLRTSRSQDQGHRNSQYDRMRTVSGPGMVLFALSLTFAAFDWLMSLDYTWYSTIFGVYVFASSVLSVLSFTTICVFLLRRQGVLADVITADHYHDLGKLIFAFTVFWAYIAFSQFFLIWYSNLPEETNWFVKRWTGNWWVVSVALVIGHFLLPFVVLLARPPKRRLPVLATVAAYMLFIHYVNMHWLVMPNLHPAGPSLSWMDVTSWVGVGGLFSWVFWRIFTAGPLVPANDPYLQASMHFENPQV